MSTGFTFADVYDEVVSRAGGEQSTAEDVVRVRRGLRLLLERWEALNYCTWRIRRTQIQSPSSSAIDYVTLQDTVDDVVHVTRTNGGELERVPIDRFMKFNRSGTSGSPGSWCLIRTDAPNLHLFPTGTSIPLIVWYVERPEEFNAAQLNMQDVPGRWLHAMVLGLAHDLAAKRPPYDENLISRLKIDAGEAEAIAARADRDRARFRYRIRR